MSTIDRRHEARNHLYSDHPRISMPESSLRTEYFGVSTEPDCMLKLGREAAGRTHFEIPVTAWSRLAIGVSPVLSLVRIACLCNCVVGKQRSLSRNPQTFTTRCCAAEAARFGALPL